MIYCYYHDICRVRGSRCFVYCFKIGCQVTNFLAFIEMSFTVLYFAVIAVYFPLDVNSHYLPIKWNVSTDVGLSSERLYEYPMFTDVAPAPCDLTANFCDLGCCNDPDCDDEQKKSFNCSSKTNSCSRPFARFDCNCNLEKSYGFAALCYVFENPIYLGLFYKTLAKIDSLTDFLVATYAGKYRYRPAEKVNVKKSYVFGSRVLAYASQNGSFTPYPHALLHDNNILSGLSVDCSVPVKYLKNEKNSCYVKLSRENCEDGLSLSAKLYLLKSQNSTCMDDAPVVVKNLMSEQTADVSVSFKSSSSTYLLHNFRGNVYKYFSLNGTSNDLSYDAALSQTYFNDSVCHNIVIRAVYKFITNASEIQKVEVQLDLTNVSVSNQFETVYLKKVHDVSFVDVNTGSESDSDNYFHNRGYYIGENLNFGFIRKNGSHSNWEKGHLKIFLNGGYCNRTRVITFGYNTYSVCLHPIPVYDCSRVSDEITLKLDSLTRGEYLAPYSSYSDPQHSAVRLLTNYNSTSRNPNGSDCFIPVQQDIYIQYMTGVTPEGFPVHEPVGVMTNRTYANLTDVDEVSLLVRVVFVDVTSSRKKRLSRFWERMYSPEGADNAWMNIFNVFDRPVTDNELEESTFWFLLPVILVCMTVILICDLH